MRKVYFILCAIILPCVSFAQIPNLDMETWRHPTAGAGTPVSLDVPASWYGSDSLIIGLGQTIGAIALHTHDTDWRRQVFEESVIVHGGSHSAKIMTVKEDSFLVPGVISNAIPSVTLSFSPPGITGIQLSGGSPVSVKPTSVSAWIKYFAGKDSAGTTGIDSGRLSVQTLAHIGGKDSIIGVGTVVIPPSSSWLQVTANIVYSDTTHPVDTIRVSFSSGRAATGLDSSTLYVDDISMASVTNPIDHTGVHSVAIKDQVKIYPNPTAGLLYIDCPMNEELNCNLYSLSGQVMVAKMLVAGHDVLDISSLPDGLYFYNIHDKGGNIVQRGKVAVSR